jgi:hypothetical protein
LIGVVAGLGHHGPALELAVCVMHLLDGSGSHGMRIGSRLERLGEDFVVEDLDR